MTYALTAVFRPTVTGPGVTVTRERHFIVDAETPRDALAKALTDPEGFDLPPNLVAIRLSDF